MPTQKHTIEIYQDEDGKKPFIEWIESIKDIIIKAKIKNRIRRIELGNFGDCKSVKKGFHELRLHFGSGYRVYFGKVSNVIILLLCGGSKNTQTKDIKKALQYWNDFKKK